MEDLAQVKEQMFRDIETIWGNKTFTFQGESYPCHVGSMTEDTLARLGGITDNMDRILIVRKSVFTDGVIPEESSPQPYKGKASRGLDKLTFEGKSYRVNKIMVNDSIGNSKEGVVYKLFLTDTNR